jgi:uncharacterized protein (TIGR02217 family)
VYPALPGLTYPVVRRIIFSTNIQRSLSGREVRVANYAAPLREWDVPYEFVNDNDYHKNGDAFAFTLQALCGFFEARYGGFDSFLYLDPDDNSATDAQIGIGNGSNKNVQVGRDLGGGVLEPLTDVTSLTVKINGSSTSAYTISSTALITFTSAPANGAVITASFSFKYRVVFNDDALEYSSFASHFYELKRVPLRQVRS